MAEFSTEDIRFTEHGTFDPGLVRRVGLQLFIGVGGGGGKIVNRIYKRMSADPTWNAYHKESTGFMVIDTNVEDLAAFGRTGDIEVVCTSEQSRQARLEKCLAEEDPFLEYWRPDGYSPRTSSLGAGQIRLESRMGFYVFSKEIEAKIQGLLRDTSQLENLYGADENDMVRVYIFGTLAGGTGSGCFLPMSCLLREVISNANRRSMIQGYLISSNALESVVKPELYSYIHSNTYAALKELEYLNRVAYDNKDKTIRFAYRMPRFPNEPIPEVTSPPFDWCSIISRPEGMNAPYGTLLNAVADTAYLNISTAAAASEHGERDNYTRFMRNLSTPTLQENGMLELGYTRHFGTLGSAALISPGRQFLEYCTSRMVADLIRVQLCPSSEGEGLDVNHPSFRNAPREMQLKLLNLSWLNAADAAKRQEEKDRAESIVYFEKAGMTPEEIEENIQNLGYWTQIIHSVLGDGATDEVAVSEEVDVFAGLLGGSEETVTDVAEQESFMAQAKAELQRLIDKMGATGFSLTPLSPVNISSAQATFADLISGYNRQIRKINELLDDVEDRIEDGEVLDALRDQSGFGPNHERYLVLQLQKALPDWIREAEGKFSQNKTGSLFDEDGHASISSEIAESLDGMPQKPSSLLGAYWHSWTGQDDQDLSEVSGIADTLNNRLSTVVSRTNQASKWYITSAVYKFFQTFVNERAASYAQIARSAVRIANTLEIEADKAMERPLDVSEDYALRLEVLQPLNGHDQPHKRLWDCFWEDKLKAEVMPEVLNNTQFVNRVVNDAIDAEEERSAAKNSAFDGKRCIKSITRAFKAKSVDLLTKIILGDETNPEANGLRIPDLLRFEAIYSHMYGLRSSTPDAVRYELLREVEDALEDEGHEKHHAWTDIVNRYLKAKFDALRKMATPLTSLDSAAMVDTPFSQTPILIGSKPVLDGLKRYEGVLDVLTKADAGQSGFQDVGKVGQQQWTSDRVMVLYIGIAVIPIYALKEIVNLHHHYEMLQTTPSMKVNDVHISRRWERSLPDLCPEARARTQSENIEGERLTFYAQLLALGVVQSTDADDEWILTPIVEGAPRHSLGENPFRIIRALNILFKRVGGLYELYLEHYSTQVPSQEAYQTVYDAFRGTRARAIASGGMEASDEQEVSELLQVLKASLT